MNTIDRLLTDGDADAIRLFNNAARMGALSEAQIAFGKAIIANPERFEDARNAVEAKIAERHAARVAEDAAKAERVAARKAAGPSARQQKIAREYAEWVAAGRPAK